MSKTYWMMTAGMAVGVAAPHDFSSITTAVICFAVWASGAYFFLNGLNGLLDRYVAAGAMEE